MGSTMIYRFDPTYGHYSGFIFHLGILSCKSHLQ